MFGRPQLTDKVSPRLGTLPGKAFNFHLFQIGASRRPPVVDLGDFIQFHRWAGMILGPRSGGTVPYFVSCGIKRRISELCPGADRIFGWRWRCYWEVEPLHSDIKCFGQDG